MKKYEDLNQLTDDTHAIVSKNVKKFRTQKGISQLNLALDIGLSGNAFLTRAENDNKDNHFNISHLVKIAYVLEVDICEFFKE
ncbi:MAG: helix-turn-helix transcriptional regulator [Campylobacterota bacterium]|nr:helix-turn-helix transcriptional regulator [Campylobacterota bacterium]